MLTNNNKLLIFENFQVDENLLKNKKNKNISKEIEFGSSSISGNFFEEENDVTIDSPTKISFSSGNVSFNKKNGNNFIFNNKKGLYYKIKQYFINKFFNENNIVFIKGKNIKKQENIVDRYDLIKKFFTDANSSMKEIEILNDVADNYSKALVQAESTGQVALFEKLKNIIYVIKSETILLNNNLNKYLSEEMVVEFYQATSKDKSLKLTWIKNYTRLIPSSVIELKTQLDEKEVFDNYVILHFDPNNESIELTENEKQKLKDPILFGVIKNSRRLYYIADWADEVCNLTLEKVIETLGKEAFEINNNTVKTYFSI